MQTLTFNHLHAGQGLGDYKDTLDSPETANVGVTETGAVVTVPTPDIVEQSERFAEGEAIADGVLDDASLAKVAPCYTLGVASGRFPFQVIKQYQFGRAQTFLQLEGATAKFLQMLA